MDLMDIVRKAKGDASLSKVICSNSSMEDAISAPIPKKKNQGRLKIAIEKIQNKNRKHVTFSKRRKRLFKKANELYVLCDASIAIITFSEAGKVFTFGRPTTDDVINRYLGKAISDPVIRTETPFENQFWWERIAVEDLGVEELKSFDASLRQIRSHVERRIETVFDDYGGYGFDGVVGGVNAGISFRSPDIPPPANQNLYFDYGCMGGGYDEASGMVPYNGFGGY